MPHFPDNRCGNIVTSDTKLFFSSSDSHLDRKRPSLGPAPHRHHRHRPIASPKCSPDPAGMPGIGTIDTASSPGPSPDKPLIERENCPIVSLVTMFLFLLEIKEKHVLFSFLSPDYSADALLPLQNASPEGEAGDSNSGGVRILLGQIAAPGISPWRQTGPPAWRPYSEVARSEGVGFI